MKIYQLTSWRGVSVAFGMELGVNNRPGIDELNSCRHPTEAFLVKIPSFKRVVVPLGHLRIFIRNATVLEVYNETSTL